ncbi:MAG: PHB depolymerase family esterase [Candidatus Obscuribacterales bacterium]
MPNQAYSLKETASQKSCPKLAARLLVLMALLCSCNSFSIGAWAQVAQSSPLASSTSSNSSNSSNRSNRSSNLAGSDELRTLQVGQLTRSYVIHRPTSLSADKLKKDQLKSDQLVPVVIVLHGGGGNSSNAASMSQMSEKSDREGFLVVYPNGSGRTNNMLTWNSGNCCAYAMRNNIDDVGFIRKLIETLVATENVDAKRVFVTGISNGGMMSFRLACELSDLIAAAAPVAGALNVDSKPANPVSIIMFNGMADDPVLYEGGTPRKSFEPRVDKSVAYAVDFWTKRNGCSPRPQRQVNRSGNVITDTYKSQSTNADVVICTIKNGKHSWPGGTKPRAQGDDPSTEVSATDMMWEFFKNHPKK